MQIGLTGNIATGKTTVFRRLCSLDNVVGFDADAEVHRLYEQDEVKEELCSLFGAQVIDRDGRADRNQLRQAFLEVAGARELLEGVFHPRVHACYAERLERMSAGQVLLADIPLLFEKEVQYDFDQTIVVACSPLIQIERLQKRSALDRSTAQGMINKQVALSHKVVKADTVIWNNGSLDSLQLQIDSLIHHIFNECR